ncbi:MAG: hypothetical protein NVS9B15_17050 [Acidobacteriaceae bacterium]
MLIVQSRFRAWSPEDGPVPLLTIECPKCGENLPLEWDQFEMYNDSKNRPLFQGKFKHVPKYKMTTLLQPQVVTLLDRGTLRLLDVVGNVRAKHGAWGLASFIR